MRLRIFAFRPLIAASALVACSVVGTDTAHAQADNDWMKPHFQRSSSTASGEEGRSGSSSSRQARRSAQLPAPSRLGGPVSEETPRRRESLSGGITWQASADCVPGQLRGVLSNVVSAFGAVRVTSTCRSQSQNRAAGGASKSYHLSGEAVDFRVLGGSTGAVYAYLSSSGSVGGLKHYGGGLFHIDTGPRRPM